MLHPDKPFARGRRTVLALFLLALGWLGLSAAMTVTGRWARLDLVLSAAGVALSGLSLLAILAAGAVRRRQIAEFAASDRPMVRWTYHPGESARMRAERWDDERADWKVQFGCLTGLFGIVGMLVGVMGYFSGELDPLVATGAGLAFGASVGAVVAAANHAGAKAERDASGPVTVVLGVGEFAFGGEYFRERGAEHVIEAMRLKEGRQADLIIETWSHPWYQRVPIEREWRIPVPPEHADAVRRLVESVGP